LPATNSQSSYGNLDAQKSAARAKIRSSGRAAKIYVWLSPIARVRSGGLPAIAATATASSSATTTTTTIATASTTTAATRTAGAGARFIDLDATSLKIGVVQGLNCGRRLARFRHLDETKAARLSGKFVRHNDRALDFPRLRKQLGQVLLGNRVGEIPYVQLRGHKSPPSEFAG